jgi:hypothetical protein
MAYGAYGAGHRNVARTPEEIMTLMESATRLQPFKSRSGMRFDGCGLWSFLEDATQASAD